MLRKNLLVLLLIALFTIPFSAHAQEEQTLIVFAAASLTDAFEEIGADFEAQNPNTRVIFNFDGSSTLATQILEQAPADVFASANLRQMQVVTEGGFAADHAIFAQNRLVVIVPVENFANIESLHDLAQPDVKLVVAAENVPIRDYTNQMIERMAESADYGTAYQTQFWANVVSEEGNVRQVALKVALGEADAAIVYASDVTPDLADRVQQLAIPDEFNTIAQYPISALSSTQNPELAQAFVDYVLSSAGQQTLQNWGFISGSTSSTQDATPITPATPQPMPLIALLVWLIQLILG